jgi:serine/threonine-protein kinase HipA
VLLKIKMKKYKNSKEYVLDLSLSEVAEPGHAMPNKCLYCYQYLENDSAFFHQACNKKFFGQLETPYFGYTKTDLSALASQVIQTQTVVTGVQAKVSLSVTRKHNEAAAKLTLVGLYGDYILKPPSDYYPHLPEVEDCTMHLAKVCGLQTVPHTLVNLSDGTRCYLTKRIDRQKQNKLHMEDMCQLTERLTEDKYKGSHEQVAKTILRFSANPILDVTNFYELVLFSFFTGNADMHLKNFSLLYKPNMGYVLAPAYDLLATALVNPTDTEELALTLNGKKRKLNYNDFLSAYTNAGLSQKLLDNTLYNFKTCLPHMMARVDDSFLTDDFKLALKKMLQDRFRRLNTN